MMFAVAILSINLLISNSDNFTNLSLDKLFSTAFAQTETETDGCWECIHDSWIEYDCVCDPGEARYESYWYSEFTDCWESLGGHYDEDGSYCISGYASCDGNKYENPC